MYFTLTYYAEVAQMIAATAFGCALLTRYGMRIARQYRNSLRVLLSLLCFVPAVALLCLGVTIMFFLTVTISSMAVSAVFVLVSGPALLGVMAAELTRRVIGLMAGRSGKNRSRRSERRHRQSASTRQAGVHEK